MKPSRQAKFKNQYSALAGRYADVLPEVRAAHDDESVEELIRKVEELGERCGKLAESLTAK